MTVLQSLEMHAIRTARYIPSKIQELQQHPQARPNAHDHGFRHYIDDVTQQHQHPQVTPKAWANG
jgi:hypothetical protein